APVPAVGVAVTGACVAVGGTGVAVGGRGVLVAATVGVFVGVGVGGGDAGPQADKISVTTTIPVSRRKNRRYLLDCLIFPRYFGMLRSAS
ncbi:MAG: hypothetical protein WAW20_16785, partial [Anaerolineae bacterium]